MATKSYSVPTFLQGKLITMLSERGALKQQCKKQQLISNWIVMETYLPTVKSPFQIACGQSLSKRQIEVCDRVL